MKYNLLIAFALLLGCQSKETPASKPITAFPTPNAVQSAPTPPLSISREAYQDKVLGLLVGSAIGDAMGAPVEMWTREAILERYGFIDQLIRNVRPASAEGVWKSNMEGGTSTDDTRWKWLVGQFLLNRQSDETELDQAFAQYLVRQYEQLKKEIVSENGLHPRQIEANMLYLQWLQEWVKVAEAWLSNDLRAYANASAQFYGGEMACAGLLYAPMVALLHPGQPELAYASGWDLSLFDLGYAKDITAMTAALTAAAFSGNQPVDSLLQLHYAVDNRAFSDSRLIGRIVNSIYEGALADYREASTSTSDSNELAEGEILPAYFHQDTAKYLRMQAMFDRMDGRLQDIPFHANEIYMITLSSLIFAQGDFMDAMVFVTNYGRDNDTAGAVVGAILGAQLGFSGLPEGLRERILQANQQRLNLDLRWLAEKLAEQYLPLLEPKG